MQELDARGAPGSEAIALASLSDAGRVRAENQDAVALVENSSRERLLLVADGMGGHRGGETAAKICLKTIERVFREPHGTPEQRLIRGLELANEEVYSHALANPELRGMGTTAVVALLAPNGSAWVAWVGDSRLYRQRDGKLEQLTQDHSLMAEWISIGVITADAAKTHPRRHELTRALGQTPDVVVDLLPIDLQPGDRLLLCSDGLHGCVADSVLARALKTGVPDVAACALVDAANSNGGPDNVSVIVAVLPDAPEPDAPEPEAPPEFEPVPVPEPGPELGFESVFAPAPEPEPDAPECAPEIAAELGALGFGETFADPEATPEVESEAEPDAEASFADLGAELIADAPSTEQPAELDEEPALSAPLEREPFSTPSAPIQIPRMTPVRARRGLDATSLVVGVATTLAVVGLGLALWSYTASRSEPSSSASRTPTIVHSTPAKPVPAVRPIENPIEKPGATPELAPAPKPVVAAIPQPAPVLPASPAPTAPAALPAPQPRVIPTQPSVPPAAADPSLEPQASVAKFEITPEVERFLTALLGALATNDRARLAELGFPNEPIALAGAAGSRDGFRLVAADIDEARSDAGRVYLRLIVSYAFRDANGRFRTQDEQRLILHDAGGRLRFAGRWQQ